MANFSLIRALGWALRSRVLSSELQQMDSDRTKVPNFAEGSSHIATNQVILHGAGAEITPLESNDLTAVVPSGSSITFQSGSILMIESGTIATLRSTLTVDHASFGATGNIVFGASAFADFLASSTAFFRSTALLDMKSGAELRSEPGAIARFLGSVLISDQGTGSTNGILTIGATAGPYAGAGRILVTSAGDVIVQSGGELKAQAGSTVWLDGDTTVHGGGTMVLDGTGGTFALLHADGAKAVIEAINGAAIDIDDSSTGNFTGSVSFGFSASAGNHATFFYPMRHIGSLAYRELRVGTLPSGGGAFTASQNDVWLVPSLSAGRIWTPANEPGIDFHYVVHANEPTTQNFDGAVNLYQVTATFKSTSGTTGEGSVAVFHGGTSDTHRLIDAFDGTMIASNGSPLLTM